MNHTIEKHRKIVSNVAKKVTSMQSEFLGKFRGYLKTAVTAAFAFVIALSWNEAIKQGVEQLIATWGIKGTSYLIKIITALFVTGICVLGIYLVSKLDNKQ